ncbi:MAG: MCE family protein [Mycobacteriaceae bacterium]|nr:MCE family protein [Mycobacteriaceae bacterium]
MRIGKTFAAIAIAGAAAAAAGCSVLPGSVNNAVGNTIEVTADFENIAGMYEGNTVAVLGMTVGRVDKIVPHGTYVSVTMSIDSDVKVPADAVAALVSPSVVTDRHIELTPAYRGKGATLDDGQHIPLERTRTPVEVDQLIKTIDQFAEGLKAPGPDGSPGPLSGRVAYPLLNGNGERIRTTLEGLSGALKVGVDNKDAVSNIIVKLNDLTTMLADNDKQMRAFSNQTTQLTSLLAQQAPGLTAVLKQLNDFLANTSIVLAQNSGELNSTLTRLAVTTAQLRRNAHNLTEVVDVAPLMFQNLANTMSPMDGGSMRLHLLTDKSLLDNETISLFCERIMMRSDGCRTGKPADFGPDLGLTAALLGISQKWHK